MRSGPSSTGKVKAKEPRVRYAISVERLTHLENAQHGAKKCHKCGNKKHFSTQCRSKQSGTGNRKSRSTSRGCKGRGKPHHSRSRSKSATKSAYSIESASFQDHSDDLHGRNTDDLHGERGDLHGNQRENLHGESADLHGNQEETSMEQLLSRPFGKF